MSAWWSRETLTSPQCPAYLCEMAGLSISYMYLFASRRVSGECRVWSMF